MCESPARTYAFSTGLTAFGHLAGLVERPNWGRLLPLRRLSPNGENLAIPDRCLAMNPPRLDGSAVSGCEALANCPSIYANFRLGSPVLAPDASPERRFESRQ